MLKLNVGLTKKIGEANYGSRGASVNLELELDSSVVGDADKLKDRIRQLFTMARASVEEELAAGGDKAASNGNGSSNGNGHSRKRDNTRPATASQIRALNAIAERHNLDLVGILTERFGTREAAQLSITEASTLIDEFKKGVNGHEAGGRR